MSELRFDGRVAVITGAGNGLGKSHALLFAARGAKVVVNDLGGTATGGGKSSAAADKVVEEIRAAGGQAVANYDSVEDGDKIIQSALDHFGRVDIVVNNAGILRDTSFAKMTQDDWDLVYRVHVLGAYRVTKAAWEHLTKAGYGRVIFTASAAGIYGNFGQANYAMAKLGLVGFSNTLAIEGRKKGVLVNTIAPIAGSRLTETVLPKEITDALKPEYVSPLVVYLAHESCKETGGLFEVGGGVFTKLRYQRTEGKLFKLGRAITPEAVQKAWGEITDFEKATAPGDITTSMQPVLNNLNTKSLGGNELIDVDLALGHTFPEQRSSYDEKDLMLYALGVGAGQRPTDATELQYVYEANGSGFYALPTFAVVPALKLVFEMAQKGVQAPGLNYGFERILHGEQYTEIKRPLPRKATLVHRARIKDIFDKGKNALVITEIKSFDESGEELIHNELTTFVRGAGGWGGDRGPAAEQNTPPDRAPDAVVTEKISESQALLYRLSGDINPLHVDPGFAQAFGFEKPILHGLCTFGYAARHALSAFCKGDPRYFKSIKVRFSDSVFPGETLVTEMWKDGESRIVFRCKVAERDKVVISGAAIELYREIPQPKAKAAAAAAGTGAAAAVASVAVPTGDPTSDEIFAFLGDYIARHPELVNKVGTTYLWKLSSPESTWTLDLKGGAGGVHKGAPKSGVTADCTLELTDADFLAMVSGKADPQKLYFGGKLKIGGNLMASQKLNFLAKLSPDEAKVFISKLRQEASIVSGGGSTVGAPPALSQANTAADTVTTADVFAVIKDYVAKHPELATQIGTVYQWKITSPDSTWTLDLKNGGGSVVPGGDAKPDCTLELSESDFLAMTSGAADPQKLYFGGKLKIGGNLMASQKLTFLKKIDPSAAKDVIASARKQGGSSPAPATTPAATQAAPKKATAAAVVKGLGGSPERIKQLGAVIQVVVKEPDAAFVLDGTAGTVREGRDSAAPTTVTLSDETLAELCQGAELRDLFQRGRIRVDGVVRPAHQLELLKGALAPN
ncbi:MAG: SDR family NAD(P)-dependent oxidoreductase [Polyangia bacterium]